MPVATCPQVRSTTPIRCCRSLDMYETTGHVSEIPRPCSSETSCVSSDYRNFAVSFRVIKFHDHTCAELIVYFCQQHRSLFQKQLLGLLREHRVVSSCQAGSPAEKRKGRAKQHQTCWMDQPVRIYSPICVFISNRYQILFMQWAGKHLCDVKAFLDASLVR